MNFHFDISLLAAAWFDTREKTSLKNGHFNNICPPLATGPIRPAMVSVAVGNLIGFSLDCRSSNSINLEVLYAMAA